MVLGQGQTRVNCFFMCLKTNTQIVMACLAIKGYHKQNQPGTAEHTETLGKATT